MGVPSVFFFEPMSYLLHTIETVARTKSYSDTINLGIANKDNNEQLLENRSNSYDKRGSGRLRKTKPKIASRSRCDVRREDREDTKHTLMKRTAPYACETGTYSYL